MLMLAATALVAVSGAVSPENDVDIDARSVRRDGYPPMGKSVQPNRARQIISDRVDDLNKLSIY
jgi:hypothetical protein